ncbi:hypothetical protein EON73_03465 [bacterium]|nr:MAG: hypothetical protein EON73_03465 [bacterium]
MAFQVGDVIRIFCDDLTGESKTKFLVTVSFSTCGTKVCFVLINTDNYSDINNTSFLKSQQIAVHCKKYPKILTHNSFFDCSRILERNIDEIESIISKDSKRLLGAIDSEDQALITSALINNPSLTPKVKKLYKLP